MTAQIFPSCAASSIGDGMASALPTREEIVRCLQQSSKAVHAGMLAKHCDVDKSDYRSFMDYLNELAALPPSALELTKRLFYGVDGLSVADGIGRGAEVNAIARTTEECRAGVRAFLERVSRQKRPGGD